MTGDDAMLMQGLLTDARRGCAPSLEQLLQILYPQFLRLARYWVKSDDAAKDIVQETLIRVSQNLSTLRNPDAFGQWSHAILKRCCISHFRQQKRLRLLETEVEILYEIADVPTADEPELCSQSEMSAAIDSLGHNSQEVVRMHYFFGMSVKEIAACVRVSAGAVRVRLHRARNELKCRLAAQGGEFEVLLS